MEIQYTITSFPTSIAQQKLVDTYHWLENKNKPLLNIVKQYYLLYVFII